MTPQAPVKTRARDRCDIVGVIANEDDLRLAATLEMPPDFFEVRLDCLFPINDEIEGLISQLKTPLIVTARHPSEGGANNLSGARRRELLSRFLPYAKYVDVELRSSDSVHALPWHNDMARILSLHDFDSTPTPRSLHAKARKAKSLGAAIFKVATRTDTPAQLARLLEFISEDEVGLPVAAMGIGSLGALSRMLLAGCGSCLAYASLAESNVEGQMPVAQLQSAFRLFGLR
jgi:3-dehydroquinate dehydratase-1